MSINLESCGFESHSKQYSDSSNLEQLEYNELTTQYINDIYENSDDAILGVDEDGLIRICNKQGEKLFKRSRKLMYGSHFSDVICGKDTLCLTSCDASCPVHNNIKHDLQIRDHNLVIEQSNGTPVQINIGSCYIYPEKKGDASTFFSIRKIKD